MLQSLKESIKEHNEVTLYNDDSQTRKSISKNKSKRQRRRLTIVDGDGQRGLRVAACVGGRDRERGGGQQHSRRARNHAGAGVQRQTSGQRGQDAVRDDGAARVRRRVVGDGRAFRVGRGRVAVRE